MRNMLHMTAATSTQPLCSLPAEPWGRRLKRAREDVAHLNLDEAAAAAAQFMLTSGPSISRLESLNEKPKLGRGTSRLGLAYVLCVAVYHVDPVDLDLCPNHLPPTVRDALPNGGSFNGKCGCACTHFAPVLQLFAA